MNTVLLNAIPLDGGVIIKGGGGGGVTINNQEKSVDITENGTTEVVADVGFTGLSKVVVNTNVASSDGGGGTELEGEYYLAKPNGRYWKSKLARIERGKYPIVSYLKSNFTEAQLESLLMCDMFFSYCALSAIGDFGGIPSSGYEVLFQIPKLAVRSAEDAYTIHNYDQGSLLGAWQECDFTMLIGMGSVYVNGLVGLMRLFSEGAFDGMSDDEVLAMASEMLMIEQVTREEYESWYNW